MNPKSCPDQVHVSGPVLGVRLWLILDRALARAPFLSGLGVEKLLKVLKVGPECGRMVEYNYLGVISKQQYKEVGAP